MPGSGAYGSPLLGLHLYTWCLILFVAAIALAALMLLMEGQFERARLVPVAGWQKLVIGLYLTITVLVGVSAFVQCGPGECPDNPTGYWLLDHAGR